MEDDSTTPALRELRIAKRSIEGFSRFLLAEEADPARRHCLEAILQATDEIERQIERLGGEPDVRES